MIMTTDIAPFKRYQAIVRNRQGGAFPVVRPEASELDGRCVTVTTGWQFVAEDVDHRPEYANEWAMILDRDCDPGIGWIASGDLVDIVEVDT